MPRVRIDLLEGGSPEQCRSRRAQPADWSMGNGIVTSAAGVPADRLDPDSVPADFAWPSIRH
jgi:hypothetical protein